ncbi:MAG: hypothetical protein R3A79_06850 [Nannocystaceae bacterium]
MPRRLTALAALATTLVLGACGPEPATGTWVFVNGEVLTNTCNFDDAQIAEGNFSIYNNGNDTFTVDPEDGTDPFLCTMSGADFICPERLQDTVSAFGATVSIRVSADGFFDSDTFASGRQEANVTCSGDACASSAIFGVDFPCTVIVNFTATYKG